MSSESLGSFIHRLSGVYRDPQRVLRDAETLLSSPMGAHLRPTTEPLMLNNGTSTPPVLLLRGTIPMTYRGVTYNLPIDMYLPQKYPLCPPTVFIRPVASMAIKENHRHVGLDGRVYLPYLHEWRAETHELRELAVWMSSLFGSEPPCYAKPVNARQNGTTPHNPPPPYVSATTASSSAASNTSSYMSAQSGSVNSSQASTNNAAEEDRRKALEKEISEANRAAEVARQAAAEEARLEAEQKRLQREHEKKVSTMRTKATSKVQYEMQQLYREMKDELRLELKNQKQLDFGKERIERLLKEGTERNGELEKGNKEMDESIEGLEKWLAAAREQQSAEDADQSEDKADLIALPADTPSAQMLALSAENAAIEDCIYFLDRSLMRGNISLEVFLKEVRRLSKRQFMAKAHLIKIAQTRASNQGYSF